MGSRLVQGVNDLETWCEQNGDRGQLILEEWDVEANWRNCFLLAPCDMHAFSTKKVMWRCRECNNVYEQAINCRTTLGQGCPICSKKRGGLKNHQNALSNGSSLLEWCERNGMRGKRLMEEWDAEKNLQELNITMKDISYGQGLKVYWKCIKCRESFMCSVNHRTISGTNCIKCGSAGTSYPEQFLYYGLKQICPGTMNREKFFCGLEYDIYVPEWNLYIEYGSSFYHSDSAENDYKKRKVCNENGGRFINILDDEKSTEDYFSETQIIVNVDEKNKNSTYEKILDYLLKLNGHSISEIDINSVHANCIRRLGKNVSDGKDVATQFPELMVEWAEELNHGAKPENYSCGSHMRIKWKCTKCNCIWENSINSRIKFKSGCPKCGYCVFDGRYHVANYTRARYNVFSFSDFY